MFIVVSLCGCAGDATPERTTTASASEPSHPTATAWPDVLAAACSDAGELASQITNADLALMYGYDTAARWGERVAEAKVAASVLNEYASFPAAQALATAVQSIPPLSDGDSTGVKTIESAQALLNLQCVANGTEIAVRVSYSPPKGFYPEPPGE
ncbi:hypothetical protein N1028_11685 [Herbiconiux sp. CPCC 203407]|uniref:Uncharacterized protein n=1 Tax=Herbiconiux oxytropis TaxID=2970915 RepID=A0AA41XHV4_9MICO|nr:hypothetical protein [Herbiconiux oxytropis]MCS5724055.1 hypothetical protein [Herbiconiux oxytropis]MCS5726555.1 hypothetical protein [Herbiconiux oxytropis]